jgi:hypothetical protein
VSAGRCTSKPIVRCWHDGLALCFSCAYLVVRASWASSATTCQGIQQSLFPRNGERVSRGERRDVSPGRSKYSWRMNSASDPLRPATRSRQRSLILEGLGEHFGSIDETRNPDVDDILHHYIRAGRVFMVGCMGREIVGTGALIRHSERTSELVRTSTHKEFARDESPKVSGMS